MSFSAVSFDADQTLWDFNEVHRRALDSTVAEMVARKHVKRGEVDRTSLQAARDEIAVEFQGRPHNLEEIRKRSFELVLSKAGCEDPIGAASSLLEHFLDIRFDQIPLYPDVKPCLQRLKKTYKIGLLSNGNSYPDRCGLPDTFDAVVLGPEVGIEKPDARVFESIAAELGVDVCSMIHVGDAADDVDGANRVGAMSVLIVRDGAPPKTDSPPDHVIGTLSELEPILERHRRAAL